MAMLVLVNRSTQRIYWQSAGIPMTRDVKTLPDGGAGYANL
jgi:hypothetical protein